LPNNNKNTTQQFSKKNRQLKGHGCFLLAKVVIAGVVTAAATTPLQQSLPKRLHVRSIIFNQIKLI